MKPYATLLAFGLLSTTVTVFAQQPTSTPAPAAASPAAVTAPEAAPATAPEATQAGAKSDPKADPKAAEPAAITGLDPNYILGADDAILIHVWRDQNLSGPTVVRPDGKISLPLVGDLQAAGLSPMALAAEITESLKKFINDPSVVVSVTAVNSRKAFFIGEVLHPGPLQMTRPMTMLQAISAAGGLTPYANQKKIYILRGEKGKQLKIPFDYKKALKNGDAQGVVLLPGDTIVVP